MYQPGQAAHTASTYPGASLSQGTHVYAWVAPRSNVNQVSCLRTHHIDPKLKPRPLDP